MSTSIEAAIFATGLDSTLAFLRGGMLLELEVRLHTSSSYGAASLKKSMTKKVLQASGRRQVSFPVLRCCPAPANPERRAGRQPWMAQLRSINAGLETIEAGINALVAPES